MVCLETNLYTYSCTFSIFFTPKCCVAMESICVQFPEMLLTGHIKIGMLFQSDGRHFCIEISEQIFNLYVVTDWRLLLCLLKNNIPIINLVFIFDLQK